MNLAEQTKTILEIFKSGFPAQHLQFIWKHRDKILTWLESQEFQEKYANHPYPPLVNPKEIKWEETDARVAWDFNLPLPPFYQMLYLCPHGTGHGAMLSLLRTAGGGRILAFLIMKLQHKR